MIHAFNHPLFVDDQDDGFVMFVGADTSGNFVSQFNQLLGSTIVAPLFGHAGAVYSAGLDGTLVRIGTPRASSAGGDTAAGQGQGTTGEGANGATGTIELIGWRQLY